MKNIYKIGKELFVTNDEEIKESDWVYYENGDLKGIHKVVNGQRPKTMILKKIILTTDQDLIKDGVQDIDDEFLEWFVAHPSCEFIEIVDDWNSPIIDAYEYRVIIPNLEMYIGERKPHSFCETPNEKCTMNYCDENGCQNRKRNLVSKEEPDYTALLKPVGTTQRQNKNLYSEEEVKDIMAETWIRCVGNDGNNFKEVRDKILKTLKTNNMGNTKQKEKVELLVDSSRINFGYESMQVKMYSEEEVLNIIDDFCETFKVDLILREDFNQWLEQFKKK